MKSPESLENTGILEKFLSFKRKNTAATGVQSDCGGKV